MSLSALSKLQNAVQKSVVRCDKLDTEKIISDGFEDFSNAMLALLDVPADLLEQAKLGDNIYSQPMALYSRIKHLACEMVKVKELRNGDLIRYALLTGHTLQSVVDHKADTNRRVSKAVGIHTPLIKDARDKRELAVIAKDNYEMQLNMVMAQISALPIKEQAKHNSTLVEAHTELELLINDVLNCDEHLLDLVEEAKNLEREYNYSFDKDGRKIYPKDSEYNREYSSIIKEGRTSLTEFARFRKLGGIESIISLADVDKSAKLFGIK